MATTAEDIRAELDKKANQRINPLLKGLSMLTGGIAGELTGTNEQMRERRQAKAALLEEQQRTLQEERMLSRIEANRKLALEEELKRIAAQDAAIAARQRTTEQEKREAARPTMRGFLESRQNYQVGGDRGLGGAMAAPISALEPIESVEQQYSYEKAMQDREEEARKQKSGYTQVNVPGFGTIGGTPDQISAIAEKYPQVKKFISGEMEQEPKYNTFWSRDPLTGETSPRISFKPGTPIEEQRKIVGELFGQQSPFTGAGEPPAPGVPGKKKQEETPTNIPGYNVRMVK